MSTLIPPNSQVLRPGIFGNVSLEPRIFSSKSGFQTRYLLNNKNCELENVASLELQVREGLAWNLLFVYLWTNSRKCKQELRKKELKELKNVIKADTT